jgi:hypothetical protein
MRSLLKSCLCSSLLLCASIAANAQLNLIVDGGFEDTTIDWQNHSGPGSLSAWHNIGGEQNYGSPVWWGYSHYDRLWNQSLFKLPSNAYFTQDTRSGRGAIHFQSTWECYAPNFPNCGAQFGGIRSIMQTKLRSKLEPGRKYCASIYAVVDLKSTLHYYTNGLQLHFGNGQLDTFYTVRHDSTGLYYGVPAQVSAKFILTDTTEWMLIQDTFTAIGTEEYGYIGNFIPDSQLLRLYEPFCYWADPVPSQAALLEDMSLIPLDASNWVPDVYVADTASSVWVGLDRLDYAEGKWYTLSGTYLSTGVGFYHTPSLPVEYFVHQIEVCGGTLRDTVGVYRVPAGLTSNSHAGFQVLQGSNNSISIHAANIASTGQPYHVSLYDMNGNVVSQQFCTAQQVLQFNVAASTYLVHVRQGSSSVRQMVYFR